MPAKATRTRGANQRARKTAGRAKLVSSGYWTSTLKPRSINLFALHRDALNHPPPPPPLLPPRCRLSSVVPGPCCLVFRSVVSTQLSRFESCTVTHTMFARSVSRAAARSSALPSTIIRSYRPAASPMASLSAQKTAIASQQTRAASSEHAISNPTLAGIEKRWEAMPPQEQAELWMQLRDRMKVNWHDLTLQEKKAGMCAHDLKKNSAKCRRRR